MLTLFQNDVEIWDEEEEELNLFLDVTLDSESTPPVKDTIVSLIVVFLLKLQVIGKLSFATVNKLLVFFRVLMKILYEITGHRRLDTLYRGIPQTVKTIRRNFLKLPHIKRMVVCPECDFPTSANEETCPYVQFPAHRFRKHRQPCGAELHKQVKTKSGGIFKYPMRQYVYVSLVERLKYCFDKLEFRNQINDWRTRYTEENVMSDIYDGNIWKSWETEYFLNENALAIMINVDWFQPFTRTQDSVGLIYAVICNLPREIRFLPKNTLILGVIPGPNEPGKYVMDYYVKPLVAELEELNNGVEYKGSVIQARVLCLTCDMPAARKVGGFVGFQAVLGKDYDLQFVELGSLLKAFAFGKNTSFAIRKLGFHITGIFFRHPKFF